MNVASFVLGLISFLGGSLLCGIPPILGIIFGVIGVSKKKENKGLGIAGIVLSGISLAGWCLAYFVFFGASIASIAAMGTY